MDEHVRSIVIAAIIVILFIEFLYLNPFGIKIGYVLSGGDKQNVDDSVNPDELYRDYNESVQTYNLYKNSENKVAVQWAENAKQKANIIASQYNEIMNEKILGEIE